MTNSGVDWWNDVLLLQQPLLNPLTLTVLALFLLTTAWLDSAALSSRGYITDDFKLAKRLTSMGNQKQLQLSAHMLWPFQFQNYLPGPRHQVLAINPICHHPHTCRPFPETKSTAHICNDDVSTSCNTHEYLATARLDPLNPRSSTDDKKSNNQNPNQFSTLSHDQSRRLGLGPTYAVSLSLDKIHYNFLQHKWD